MNYPRHLAACLLGLLFCSACLADETIVMVRHGEKPEQGLGQLNCQGLNRSLALPAVLQKKFDRPAAIFAPNPGIQKSDRGQLYNYIRPLATIEPTAIALELPVNTQYGLEDIDHLQTALLAPAYQEATILVAWEHHLLEQAARKLLAENGGNPAVVPLWDEHDYDSIYIITVTSHADGKRSASFRHEVEGLNLLPTTCPK